MNDEQELHWTSLGRRLKSAREYLDLSQDEAAKAVGLSRSALSQIERGKRRVDSLELTRFASLYGQSVDALNGSQSEAPLPESVKSLARKATELSDDDREQLLRFAEFLQGRPKGSGKSGKDG